jgi:hypothetical protein
LRQQQAPREHTSQSQQSQQREVPFQWDQRQPQQPDRSNQRRSSDQQSYEAEEEEEEEEGQEEEYDGKIPKHLMRKEAEKIILPPFPDVVSFRAWKTQVVHAVVQASARPDTQIVIAWINKSFEKGIAMEDLQGTPKHFISLDGKVVSAVQYILNQAGTKGKTLLSKITMKMQELLESKQILLTGRQAVFMVAQNFKTANDTETYLGIEHLANLVILNNDLEQFWMRWEQMLGQLPPDSIQNRGLETMLYGKIRKHPEMAVAIKEYERAAPTSALKSYDWLAVEVRRTCSLDMMHRNFQDRDDRMRELLGGKALKAAAAQDTHQSSKKKKKDKDSAPQQAAPMVAPSKGEKGERHPKDGKGAKKGDRNSSQGKGEPQGKGQAPKLEGQQATMYAARDPSTLHCYWFHHPKGCQRPKCLFRHDKKIPIKEKEELMALNLEKRSSSAPVKQGGKGEARTRTKICFEFQKEGSCSKGADCAYEHVALPDGKKQSDKKKTLALASPAIFLFDAMPEDRYIAAAEDMRRKVTFPEVKIIRGARNKYEKDVTVRPLHPVNRNPETVRIHARIAVESQNPQIQPPEQTFR